VNRTLIIPLAILALLLPGCMGVASFGAAAWAGVQTISRMVRAIEFIVPDKEEAEEDEEADAEEPIR
jgi:hypothetical protein